ncbi:MAG TPA: hypothetical protein VGG68_15685 [Caulobacteraceae bacterium]|jgi:hypothetical protein
MTGADAVTLAELNMAFAALDDALMAFRAAAAGVDHGSRERFMRHLRFALRLLMRIEQRVCGR